MNWEKNCTHKKEREITKTERESFRITEWKIVSTGKEKEEEERTHLTMAHNSKATHSKQIFFIPNRTKLLLYVFLFFRIEQKNFFFRSEILSHFSFFFLCCFCCVLQYCLWFKSKMKKIKKTVHARTNTHSLAIARARTHRPRHTHQREEKSFKVAIMQKTFVLNYLAFCQQFR